MKMVSHVVMDLEILLIGQSFQKFDRQNQPTYNPQKTEIRQTVESSNQRYPSCLNIPIRSKNTQQSRVHLFTNFCKSIFLHKTMMSNVFLRKRNKPITSKKK